MNNVLITQKIQVLLKYGLSTVQATKLVSGAAFLQDEGGPDLLSYWCDCDNFTVRDEFFLIANTIFPLALFAKSIEGKDWLLTFQAAYLSQVKQNAQSIYALDTLLKSKCYADAFGVIRSLHSRTNLLLLFSFAPDLFRNWLKNPKDPKFLDGHVRNELEKHGVKIMGHSYEFASELLHGQIQALSDIGLFEKGIFNSITAINKQLYVLGKFIIAASSYSIIQALLIGESHNPNSGVNTEVAELEAMFDSFFDTILSQNRWDHMFTVIANDRHWKKIGKNKFDIGGSFNYLEYKQQLNKFHKNKGQKKQLSKEYR
jgi:hypothetical protein